MTMRKLRALVYILKQSLINLVRNWYMLLASVFVLFTALYIMGCFGLASVNITHILEQQANHPEVEIICRETVSDDASLEIAKVILEDPRVHTCVRVSRAENLERIKEMMEGYEDLFQYEDEASEYLYVSFDITLDSAEQLESFADDMTKVTGVSEVKDNRTVYEYFTAISDWVDAGTYVALIVLGFLSILLMLNTIRLTVMARQKELHIMKYVGASYAYMRGPFIAEGIVIGLVGAFMTYFAVRGTYGYIADMIAEADESVASVLTLMPFSDLSMKVLGLFVLGGVATGLIASMLTIKKHIKV